MILFLLLMLPIHVEGSGNVWTEGGYTWAGPSSCYQSGFLLQKGSDAIDQGVADPGLHCDHPGFDLSGCIEWFGSAPDIGACEMNYSVPKPPSLTVN